MTDPGRIAATIGTAPRKGRRRLVALAGPPASGKSTLAEKIATAMTKAGSRTEAIAMDGFHLDNRLLEARGLIARKGAPETFDVAGLLALIGRLASEAAVICPVFDRARDCAIAGAVEIGPDCGTVIIEGNYLLLDAPGWRDLHAFWDLTLWLNVPIDVLRQRSIDRWLTHGLDPVAAEQRADGNDMVNARLVSEGSVNADMVLEQA